MHSQRMYSVIVVEDENDVRKELVLALEESLEFIVVGEASSVSEAYSILKNEKVDMMFLDIKLREGDAFQLLHKLKRDNMPIPHVVLNTGYQEFEYAQRTLNEFSNEVLLILKKPFWENWSEKENEILEKLQSKKSLIYHANSDDQVMRFRLGNTSFRIQISDLILIRTHPDGKGKGMLEVVTQESRYRVYEKIKDIIEILPTEFVQINRNTIINMNYVVSYNHVDKIAKVKFLPEDEFTVTKTHQTLFEELI